MGDCFIAETRALGEVFEVCRYMRSVGSFYRGLGRKGL
jgi:hypothetical protein